MEIPNAEIIKILFTGGSGARENKYNRICKRIF